MRKNADLTARLMQWYDRARRDLPWRATEDPYAIWVGEVMLQQTQTVAVHRYFERWLRAFPTVQELAESDEDQALQLWQGLGYYSRCRNLLRGAKLVSEKGWPASVEEWRSVPGVGPYMAGAIASRVCSAHAPAIDGNAARVYARHCLDASVGGRLLAAAGRWSLAHMDPARPGDWNQALMELGATVCRPRAPLCADCPLQTSCSALRHGRVEELPTSKPKPRPVRIQLRYDVPIFHQMVGVLRDDSQRWWRNLWVFPPHLTLSGERRPLPSVHCVVTRHRVEILSDLVLVERCEPHLRWQSFDETESLALPAPHRRLLRAAMRESTQGPRQSESIGSDRVGTASVPSGRKK